MKSSIRLVILILILFGAYAYRDELTNYARVIMSYITPPCSKPIPYSLGTFDSNFGLSKDQLLSDIREAGSVWEQAAQKQLFSFDGTNSPSDLKVNLIYDYRQSATDKMSEIGGTIESGSAQYLTLKNEIDAKKAAYTSLKAAIDAELGTYESDKASYEQQVSYWNSKGGAPKAEYDSLQNMRAKLNAEAQKINDDSSSINQIANEVNGLVSEINPLAQSINTSVSTYNKVSATTGGEFEEGDYESDTKGRRINIYQFTDNDKLVRLLVHELGHSLGLDHVDDSKAIMYYLNNGVNIDPTKADIAELKAVCKLK